MTHFEYELAFRAVIGLAGCAIALVALAFDWREENRFESWRDASLKAIAEGMDGPITGWRYDGDRVVELGVNPTRIDQ